MSQEDRDELMFNLSDENPDVVVLPEWADRLLGVARRSGEPSTLVYQDNDGRLGRLKPKGVYLMDYDYRPLAPLERKCILRRLKRTRTSALSIDDHDMALLGVAHRVGQKGLLIYSVELIVEGLIAQGMSNEEAWEFHEFNIAGAYMGPGTPLLL